MKIYLLLLFLLAVQASSVTWCARRNTRNENQKCCNRSNHRLPGLSSREEMSTLVESMASSKLTSVWLKLKRKQLPQWTWIDNTTASGAFHQGSGERCVYFNRTSGSLSSGPCSQHIYGRLCERKHCTSCKMLHWPSHGCINALTSCYLFFCTPNNWFNSRRSCQARGGDLAVVNTTSLHQILSSTEPGCDIFWVGLRKEVWSTSEVPTIYGVWGENEPSEKGDCAILREHGNEYYIYSENCQASHGTICVKGSNGQGVTSSVLFSGSVTSVTIKTVTNHHERRLTMTAQVIIGLVTGILVVAIIVGSVIFALLRKKKLGKRKGQKRYIQVNVSSQEHEMGIPLLTYNETESQIKPKELRKIIAKRISALHSKLELWSWVGETAAVPLEEIYIDLSTERIDQLSASKQPLSSYTDMFEKHGKEGSRIALDGEAGSGKTTMVKKIILDWSRLVLKRKGVGKQSPLSQFKFVVPIFLRRVSSGMCLRDIIADQLDLKREMASSLCNMMSNFPEEFLLIFDGYDEFNEKTSEEIVNITKGKSGSGLNVLVTIRSPVTLSLKDMLVSPDLVVHLKGFTGEGNKRYVEAFFRNTVDSKQDKMLQEIEKSSYLKHYSVYPAILLLMCVLWKDSKRLAENITDFYEDFVRYACMRYERKYKLHDKQTQKKDILNKYNAELLGIGQIAVEGLKGEELQLNFILSDVVNAVKPTAFKLGFFLSVDKKKDVELVSFHHKLLQEYFAAYYIVNCKDSERLELLIHFYKSPNPLRDSTMFTKFITGLGDYETVSQIAALLEGSQENTPKIITDLQLQYLSEKPSSTFPLPQAIEIAVTEKHTSDIYARYLSNDATKVDTIRLSVSSFTDLSMLLQLKAPNLSSIYIETVNGISSDQQAATAMRHILPGFQNLQVVSCSAKRTHLGTFDAHVVGFFKRMKECKHLVLIDFSSTSLSEDMVGILADALPEFSRLEELKLDSCQIRDDGGMKAILTSLSNLRRLSVLKLRNNTGGNESLLVLIELIQQKSSMRELCLWNQSGTSEEAMSKLIDSLSGAHKLVYVDLSKITTNLSAYGNLDQLFASLASLRMLHLCHLHAAFTWYEDGNTESTEITLEGASVTADDIAWLGQQLNYLPNLQGVSINSCECSAMTSWGPLIQDFGKFPNMKKIKLEELNIEMKDLTLLGTAVSPLEKLLSFSLHSCNDLEKESFANLLLNMSKLPSLNILSLDGCVMNSESLQGLTDTLPKFRSLLTLSLSHCNIMEDMGTADFMQALCHCTSLVDINLEGNPLGDNCINALTRGLSTMTAVKNISLRDCSLRDRDVILELVKAIPSCPSLVQLNLSKNFWSNRYNVFMAIGVVAQEANVRTKVILYE